MRDHTKLRAFELADEVRLDSVRAQRLTAFSLQPEHLSSYGTVEAKCRRNGYFPISRSWIAATTAPVGSGGVYVQGWNVSLSGLAAPYAMSLPMIWRW